MKRRVQTYPNAVLRWKLGESGSDSTWVNDGSAGSAMNLVNIGNAADYRPGTRSILSRGITFHGSSSTQRSLIYTANPSSDAHIITGTQISVSAWLQIRRQVGTNYNVIVKAYDSTLSNYTSAVSNQTLALAAANSGNIAQFAITTGTAGSGTRTTVNATGSKLYEGLWYHLAGTYDGEFMRIFVNGALWGETAKTGNIDYSSTNSNRGGPWAVGGQPSTHTDAAGQTFDGTVEEAVIESMAHDEEVWRSRDLQGRGLLEKTGL